MMNKQAVYYHDHVPKAMSSPFPPLKNEVRYRGVYERAGFDVNLGGLVRLAAPSMKSPLVPRHGFPKAARCSKNSILPTNSSLSSGSAVSKPFFHQNPASQSQGLFYLAHSFPLTHEKPTLPYDTPQASRLPWDKPLMHQRAEKPRPQPAPSSYNANDVYSLQHPQSSQHLDPYSESEPLLYDKPSQWGHQAGFPTPGVSHAHAYPEPAPAPLSAASLKQEKPYLPFDKKRLKKTMPQHTEPELCYPLHDPLGRSPSIFEPSQSTDSFATAKLPSSPERTGLPNDGLGATPPRLVPPHDAPERTALPGFNKNIKNLTLDLGNSPHTEHEASSEEFTFNDTQDTSVERSAEPIEGKRQSHASSVETNHLAEQREYPSQQHPQIVSSIDDSFSRKKRLTALLDDFRKDVEEHKKYEPGSSKSTPSIPQQEKFVVPTFVIQDEDTLRFSYDRNTYAGTDRLADPSSQFEQFKNQQSGEDLSGEYQQFLNGNLKGPAQRESQMSTVSSIISRDHGYQNEEDDEVEQELERQLQSLKAAGSGEGIDHELSDLELSRHPSTSDANSSVQSGKAPLVMVNAEHSSDDSTEDDASDCESQISSNASFESVQPLSVCHSRVRLMQPLENEEALERFANVDTPRQQSMVTFEQKPLLPNSHQVGEELSNMNFEIDNAVPQQVSHEGVAGSMPPPTFQPFPESESESSSPALRKLCNKHQQAFEHNVMYPPGQGPCRGCHLEVSPSATGSKKAIFSRSGELLGQWHRACFTCTSANCLVKFNKSVQCYAYEDEAYCALHYHELNGTLCLECLQGIEGDCIENEVKQKWHLTCLTCHKCNGTINCDYYLINNHIYCERDATLIIRGGASYSGFNGNERTGLSASDRIEKRRTRLLFLE